MSEEHPQPEPEQPQEGEQPQPQEEPKDERTKEQKLYDIHDALDHLAQSATTEARAGMVAKALQEVIVLIAGDRPPPPEPQEGQH